MPADVEQVRRDTALGFLRVVEQQGRVTLAAERNAQVDILLHQIRALATDLIGPRGTPGGVDAAGKPTAGPGFDVTVREGTEEAFGVAAGHYWVNGRLCALDARVGYTDQDHRPLAPKEPGRYLVYLDVWERHVGAAEDPTLLEPALGGPDSCSRSKLVFQVKVLEEKALQDILGAGTAATPAGVRSKWTAVEDALGRLSRAGRLVAGVDRAVRATNPCLAAPAAGYTGGENQLVRVEVLTGGAAGTATFTWAYDNASVEHRLVRVNGTTVVLDRLPRDVRKGLSAGARVEVLSDDQVRNGERGLLTTVHEVDDEADDPTVVLDDPVPFDRDGTDGGWALLRRWDPPEGDGPGAMTITEGTPLTLADGVQVTFLAPVKGEPAWTYRPGDHWTIPVRTATGDVLWPRDDTGGPVPLPPDGVEHSYAPLALVTLGPAFVRDDLREFFAPLARPL